MNEILIVEDNEDIRDLIQRYLSVIDVEIHFAVNGEEGVEKYEKLKENGKTPNIVSNGPEIARNRWRRSYEKDNGDG